MARRPRNDIKRSVCRSPPQFCGNNSPWNSGDIEMTVNGSFVNVFSHSLSQMPESLALGRGVLLPPANEVSFPIPSQVIL